MKRPKIAQGEGKDGSGMYMPESTLPSKNGRFRAVQGISAFFKGGFSGCFGVFFRRGRIAGANKCHSPTCGNFMRHCSPLSGTIMVCGEDNP